MRQRKLEAWTRPFDRAQQGDENGPIPMSIAVKLREIHRQRLPVMTGTNTSDDRHKLQKENDLAQ